MGIDRIVVKLVTTEDGTKIKTTIARVEMASERIYNHVGRARWAARRLVLTLNAAAGFDVATLKE